MPTKHTKTAQKRPESARKKAARVQSLSLAVQYTVDAVALPNRAQFRRWVRAAIENEAVAKATVGLRIVGAAEGRQLNSRFRHKRQPTNVLSFTYDMAPLPKGKKLLSGDIVLCAPVIAREAREQGKPLAAHYAHLTIHGMLHLQGYDHQRDTDANRMERLETAILKRLGLPDPYGSQSMGARQPD